MSVSAAPELGVNRFETLWLEVTRSCNEQCTFCYNESGPNIKLSQTLPKAFWFQTATEARDLGCESLIIIGGEPLVLPWIKEFIEHISNLGFSYSELATNATLVTDALAQRLADARISTAISIYSDDPQIHDEATQLPGSLLKTLRGIATLRQAGVPVRINVVNRTGDDGLLDRVKALVGPGPTIWFAEDRVRALGRATDADMTHLDKTKQLCGGCANNYGCVSASGDFHPCIMARHYKLGSVLKEGLGPVSQTNELVEARKEILEVTTKEIEACGPNYCVPNHCTPHHCSPDVQCGPDKCGPQRCLPGY